MGALGYSLEDSQYLEDNWGTMPVAAIAKKLIRDGHRVVTIDNPSAGYESTIKIKNYPNKGNKTKK